MTETLALLLFLLSPMCVSRSSGDGTTSAYTSDPPTTSAAPPESTLSSMSPSSEPESALLSHVYDAHSNLRHHHHNHPWGPHFEENPINITVDEGGNTVLDCRVGLIEDKLVSWVRRKSDRLDVLTLGNTNHSSDSRISSDFKYPNNWRLAISNASRNDSGTYLCQISTHPPKVLQVQLTVQAPEVFIVNSRGDRITEAHYKEGSTLQLICSVNNVLRSRVVNWFRNKDLLNHDVSRGGVSIKTDMTGDEARSVLRVALVTRKDGGTYLCSAPPLSATITVHVLNGENPAELYHNVVGPGQASPFCLIPAIFLLWVTWTAAAAAAAAE